MLKKQLDGNKSSDITDFAVLSNTNVLNVKSICLEIDAGDNGNGGINLKPFYQREYKFTRIDESKLIESLLIGIPIPTIYLSSDAKRIPHTLNVIDGQHRLRAIHRFVNNKFELKGLEKYKSLIGSRFDDLDPLVQNKLLYQISLTMQIIHVQDNPDLEIEIFTRYNKGTHQLHPQEIRGVVYHCIFNDWLNSKVKELKDIPKLKEVYNISTKRYIDREIHADLYLIFAIIFSGINKDYYASTEYIEDFMKKMSLKDDDIQDDYVSIVDNILNNMNLTIDRLYLSKGILNPFSKEIYMTIDKRNHKFQTSIVMIMCRIFSALAKVNFTDNDIPSIQNAIKLGFLKGKFSSTTSSTTHPALLNATYTLIASELNALGFKIEEIDYNF